MKDVLIIGAGTAGLTAAIYARRAGLSVSVFEGNVPGGKIVTAAKIENYPGLPGVSGYDYASALLKQAKDLGAEIIYDSIRGAELKKDPKVLISAKEEYEGKTVIIANGASKKLGGFLGEKEFEGKGVSYCATCDGNFFKGKNVLVIGGGDTALEDAEYLSDIVGHVTIISKDSINGSKMLQEALAKKENITFIENAFVTEVTGSTIVEKAFVKDKLGTVSEISVSGVFVAVGTSPNNSVFENEIVLDKKGYIVAGEDTCTAVPGVFAAGDTRRKVLKQLVTAASDGANAATEALVYIKNSRGNI